ncbi:hypothetical protein Dsin_003609 [Dipteronia sinensis]|uniref:Uncharacterized protein n=1 Tax=Dipteronia sinensis TaxID=43782 RepID=A0AAE0EKE9_9ROSI|nr:hypothetical protein Dsin_003609 [Dipteronia sinensis]
MGKKKKFIDKKKAATFQLLARDSSDPYFDETPDNDRAYDASRVQVNEVKNDDAHERSIYSVASKSVGVKVQRAVDPEVGSFF